MSNPKVMIGWVCEFKDGSTRRGSVGVPADNTESACRRVAAAIRTQYGQDCDDVSVVVLGPA